MIKTVLFEHHGFIIGWHKMWRFSPATCCYFVEGSSPLSPDTVKLLLENYRQYLLDFGFDEFAWIVKRTRRHILVFRG